MTCSQDQPVREKSLALQFFRLNEHLKEKLLMLLSKRGKQKNASHTQQFLLPQNLLCLAQQRNPMTHRAVAAKDHFHLIVLGGEKLDNILLQLVLLAIFFGNCGGIERDLRMRSGMSTNVTRHSKLQYSTYPLLPGPKEQFPPPVQKSHFTAPPLVL